MLEEAALAWASFGDFDAAWRVWNDVDTPSSQRPSPDAVFSAIATELVRTGGDGKIMAFVHSDLFRRSANSLTREATVALADWAIVNADSRTASGLIARYRTENALEIRQLRAKLAMLDGDDALALSLVAAEKEPVSLALRADALSRLGDRAAASSLPAPVSSEPGDGPESVPGGHESGVDASRLTVGPALSELLGGGSPSPVRVERARAEPAPNPVELPTQEAPQPIAIRAEPMPAGNGADPDRVTISASRNLLEASRASRAAIVALLEESKVGSPESTP